MMYRVVCVCGAESSVCVCGVELSVCEVPSCL